MDSEGQKQQGDAGVCVACERDLQAGALVCRACGAAQPRTQSAPVGVPLTSRSGHHNRPALVATILGTVILLAALVTLLTRSTALPARSPRPVRAPTSVAASVYLAAVRAHVLARATVAQDAIAGSVQAARSGREGTAASGFRKAEHLYGGALATLARLHPPISYLRYQDDLLQGLTAYLRSAVLYNQWAANHSQKEMRQAVVLGQQGLHFLTLASGDAPSS